MASNDRFYQVVGSRPFYWGDLGNRLQISGFYLEGEDCRVLVAAPSSNIGDHVDSVGGESRGIRIRVIEPSIAEWGWMLKELDDPKVFEMDETGFIKAIHRKIQKGSISGAVQQKIWARDDFKCMFCGRKMGDVQLSVDHFEPLEFGGSETEENLLSACRKCNKKKGSISARNWCAKIGRDYDFFVNYLSQSQVVYEESTNTAGA